MEPEQSEQLERILTHMSLGVCILGSADMRLRYVNPYLLSLLDQPVQAEDVLGKPLRDILTDELFQAVIPFLQQARTTGKRKQWDAIPYEGFLAARGRTYWRVTIEGTTAIQPQQPPSSGDEAALLITIEDVTELVRSRLYVNAIHSISSAIMGPFALPRVLDRILQAVQEMVGSTRCAILLIEHSVSGVEFRYPGSIHQPSPEISEAASKPPTVTIAAQKGMHIRSQDWRPQLSEQLLLGRVVREQQAVIIRDTSTVPEMNFPLLDDDGTPRRPGSALCIPIFEPTDTRHRYGSYMYNSENILSKERTVLGTIEVYHRRARGFPDEEVKLLEQFAQQAGLAIQNARLFRRINQLARDASRNLRQREHIMQAIPDGVIIYDSRWRVADANQAIRTLLGWSTDVIGLPITEAMARSTATFPNEFISGANPIQELDQRVLERRIEEFKMVGADGKSYTMRCSYAPIHDELGDIFASVILYHDVTEQAAARERIEAEVVHRTAELAQRNKALELVRTAQNLTNARMELLLERLPSGVMLVSADNKRVTVINHQATQILQNMGVRLEPLDDLIAATHNAVGRNAEEFLRIPIMFTATGTLIPSEERPLMKALNQGEAVEAEIQVMQPDGQPLFLLVSAAPLRTREGIITNAVVVLHDITKLKALERAREDFFTTMAHELKTPLANIRAHLSALQADDYQWSPEAQRDFLETADEQVDRLVRMINHFLDASRVEAGALRLELEPIFLPEMFEDLEERLEALIASSHRRLQIDIPSSLPAVMADYELIMSVLTNLVSNAFRYAPEGDIVLLAAKPVYEGYEGHEEDEQCPTGVELRVVDRGPGMSREQQAALFTRFSTFAAMSRPAVDRPGQPTAEKRRRGGRWSPATGLGLYISRGIIEAHGSKLTLQSSPGEGASFAFILAAANANTLRKEE